MDEEQVRHTTIPARLRGGSEGGCFGWFRNKKNKQQEKQATAISTATDISGNTGMTPIVYQSQSSSFPLTPSPPDSYIYNPTDDEIRNFDPMYRYELPVPVSETNALEIDPTNQLQSNVIKSYDNPPFPPQPPLSHQIQLPMHISGLNQSSAAGLGMGLGMTVGAYSSGFNPYEGWNGYPTWNDNNFCKSLGFDCGGGDGESNNNRNNTSQGDVNVSGNTNLDAGNSGDFCRRW
ncbi:uncharacterized protein L201_003474 [Kwoniella dendrophila CBS 6074]|uniref:Uncharacterized protein n=1 Tax=Kwoniella dendrophila CBS 6074 TaxID=1295534 RepID=A0AAX4JT15_9TREE